MRVTSPLCTDSNRQYIVCFASLGKSRTVFAFKAESKVGASEGEIAFLPLELRVAYNIVTMAVLSHM